MAVIFILAVGEKGKKKECEKKNKKAKQLPSLSYKQLQPRPFRFEYLLQEL